MKHPPCSVCLGAPGASYLGLCKPCQKSWTRYWKSEAEKEKQMIAWAAERATRLRPEEEVKRSHAALDRVHRYLLELGPTLTSKQILLCLIDACKWRKHPEWEERYEYLQTPQGAADEELQFQARAASLREKPVDLILERLEALGSLAPEISSEEAMKHVASLSPEVIDRLLSNDED